MTGSSEVPDWCRTDVEDAIADAVSWCVLNLSDQVAAEARADRTRLAATDPLRRLRFLIADQRDDITAAVIGNLQRVGVPFSGATGAGAEWDQPERRAWQAIGRPCGVVYSGDVWTGQPCIKDYGHNDDMHADWYGRTWESPA